MQSNDIFKFGPRGNMELDSDDAEIPWYLESNTQAKTADSYDEFRNRYVNF